MAQSIKPTTDGTNTTTTPNNNQINITGGQLSQDKANLFHSFERFGLNSGEIANFVSNPQIQNILGRITGGNASYINGLIQVTGGNSNLFLMNPAGIVFGPNSSLNVPASFTATTAGGIGFRLLWFNASGVNDYTALVGTPSAFAFPMNNPGGIVNFGSLSVSQGENITFLGGTVINTGNLSAPAGTITLAAIPGENVVRLSQAGHLLSLEVQSIVNAGTASLAENWRLPIPSLPELLTGGNIDHATELTVNSDGTLQLAGSGITIPTDSGTTITAGNIDVSAVAGGSGGEVNLFGNKVGLFNVGINASGSNGGGNVRIGGDYKGLGTVPNAGFTFISSDSTINADALTNGNGGRVIVWSEEATRIYGNLSVQGGKNAGNGGFVETSSRQFLDITTTPNIAAPAGLGGTWLIDPNNIEIVADGSGNSNITPTSAGAPPNTFTTTSNTARIEIGLIYNALLSGDVTVSTGTAELSILQQGNITLSTPLDYNGIDTEKTLTLNAHNNIFINQQISDSIPDGDSLNLVLNANSDNSGFGRIQINAPIITGGGNLTMNGRGDNFAGITINNPIITEGGSINLTGTSNSREGILINSSVSLSSGGGNINLTGTSSTSIGIAVPSVSFTSAGGNISFNSNNSISANSATLDSQSPNNGGEIALTAPTGITVSSLNTSSSDSGNAGTIALNSSAGNITTTFDVKADASSGNGGLIEVLADGNITTGFVSSNSQTASAGNININSSSGSVSTGSLEAITQGIDGGAITISAANNISVTNVSSETIGSGSGGDIFINAGNALNVGNINSNGSVGTGNISLAANEINFNGTSVAGQGTLTLQPFTSAQAIRIGGAGSDDINTLDISALELGILQDGFSAITMGGDNSSGAISFGGNVSFNDPLILRSPVGAGTISTNSFTLSAPALNAIAGSNITVNADITTNGNVDLIADADGTGDGTLSISNALINTNGGNLTGSGKSNIDSGEGVGIFNSTIDAGGGNIALTGTSANTGTDNEGINLRSSQLQTSDAGTITLIGSGIAHTDNSLISSVDGDISLTGTGTGATDGYGIDVRDGATIRTTGAGNISLTGTSTGNGNDNHGIILHRSDPDSSSSGIVETTGTGNISLSGTASANATGGTGIILFSGATVRAAGSGSITLEGTGGSNEPQAGVGIDLGDSGSLISAVDGDIRLTGTGKGGNEGYGIEVRDGAMIRTTGVGNIFLTGTSEGTGSNNNGIILRTLDSTNSPIVETTGTGNITLTGTGSNGATGILLENGSINPTGVGGTGTITLSADEIDLLNTTQIRGTGTLILQALTPSLDITVGGTVADTRLNLDADELNTLPNGFSQIFIGGDNGNGVITQVGDLTFNDPVTVQSPNSGGAIDFTSGTLTGTDNATITLAADGDIITGNITNPGRAVTATSSTGSINTSAGTINTSNSSGTAGEIRLEALTGNVSSGNLNASGTTGGGNITVLGAGTINARDINSSTLSGKAGDVIIDPIDITVNTINAESASGTGGNVTVEASRFIRVPGSFSSSFCLSGCSISAAGGTANGGVVIRHGGGYPVNQAFVVGDATTNGTAAAIVGSSTNVISPIQSFPGPYIQGNIQITALSALASDVTSVLTAAPTPTPETTPAPAPTPVPALVVAPAAEPTPEPAPTPEPHKVNFLGGDNQVFSSREDSTLPQQGNSSADGKQQTPGSVLAATQASFALVESNLASGNVEAVVLQIDQLQAEEMGDYYGMELTSPLTTENIRELLRTTAEQIGNRSGIIYVLAQPDQLELILFTADGKPIHKRVSVSQETLLKVASDFRTEVTNPLKQNSTSYLQSSQQLYQWIIAPLEPELQAQGIQTLLFSMDTGLRTLPIAALHDGQGFLIEKYSFSLIPSISLTDIRYQSLQNMPVLAMGASEFQELVSLPAVPLELSNIVEETKSPKYFLNQEFTLKNLQTQRASYPYGIIHLATHGEFNPGTPSDSYIQLWDTKLQLNQLRQMRWNDPQVQLLVLSACRTAVGDTQAELGFAGLALGAGVKSALASVWYVDDTATLALMKEFYRQLRLAGEKTRLTIKSEALRQAQLALLSGQIYLEDNQLVTANGRVSLPPSFVEQEKLQLKHPYFWAGFTMIGSPW
ncbi:MAG: CHAT domain-containing protein [Microcoleus vaginatus WJT46-NPBG5]|nr:CHAT domain-containing protein [Microcoleus vaginatus WJT46-NPBG5]